MPFTLRLTKQLNMLWVATRRVFTILLLLVNTFRANACPNSLLTSPLLATSGAAATIASDAFMNPFDGMLLMPHPLACRIRVC